MLSTQVFLCKLMYVICFRLEKIPLSIALIWLWFRNNFLRLTFCSNRVLGKNSNLLLWSFNSWSAFNFENVSSSRFFNSLLVKFSSSRLIIFSKISGTTTLILVPWIINLLRFDGFSKSDAEIDSMGHLKMCKICRFW